MCVCRGAGGGGGGGGKQGRGSAAESQFTVRDTDKTSYCSYARPAQPSPNRTRLCRPYIVAITGD